MGYQIQEPFQPPIKVFETGVAAVTAGLAGPGGWVSGNPASLALSASVDCLFDLGLDWSQYNKVAVSVLSVAPSSGFSGVQVSSSNTTSFNNSRMLNEVDGATFGQLNAAITTSGLGVTACVKPMGRYLIVRLTNADAANAQGATAKVTVGAFPN